MSLFDSSNMEDINPQAGLLHDKSKGNNGISIGGNIPQPPFLQRSISAPAIAEHVSEAIIPAFKYDVSFFFNVLLLSDIFYDLNRLKKI
jgi:hypothetical protein